MHEMIERLAYKIGEGFQASSMPRFEDQVNIFHRNVATLASSDLSFINGLISTGLRGSALLNGEKLISNYNQLLTASRQHLSLVLNTNARLVDGTNYSALNNYAHLNAMRPTGCFQLVATSLQQEIQLTLIAHRIAELSLIPGIVISDYDSTNTEAVIPDDELIKKYLGDPDDQIDCPTPAQEMIFGRTRRRIPNWFSFDSPVMLGSMKDGEAISKETAANQKYFYDHLPQLIDLAFSEYKEVFGDELKAVEIKGNSSKYAIVSYGDKISELYDQLSPAGTNVELIKVNLLNPFPLKVVEQAIKGKKSLTILENISGPSSTYSPFHADVLKSLGTIQINIYSTKYGSDIAASDLDLAIQHMVSNQAETDYFLGVTFTKSSSPYPKHEILLQEIEKRYPTIAAEGIQSKSPTKGSTSMAQDDIPLAIRMRRDMGPNYSRLSRFHDHTAFFYEHDEQQELVADPFASVPSAPAASASFFNQSGKRSSVPIFDSVKCTGCGDCFTHCPHSALPPIAIGTEQFIKTGAEIASKKGEPILGLTPMIKNLAKVADKILLNTDISTVNDFLPEAFDQLAAQMKMDGDKLELAKNEMNRVVDELDAFPLALTDQFFKTPTLTNPGSGDLFSISVNPTSCTGCSICVEVCEEDALILEPCQEESETKIATQFKLWEQLPDTSGDTINRLLHDQDYPSLAAMLLSRNFYMTMTGANDSEEHSPFKSMLHIVTATTESVLQPKVLNHIKHIDELIHSLSENVHKKLSDALPDQDLESLSKSLRKTQRRKIHIQDLVNQLGQSEQGKFVDSEDLLRKTDLIEDLKNLKWILTDGPSGVGQSRYGLLLAGSNFLEWAKQYPVNHFTNPSVIHWNGSAPDQTLGLFHGQLRYRLDHFKLLRRAELESKNKYDATVHDLEIAELSWHDLTILEKQLIPPILLVAEREELNETGWNSINKLLAEKYPVKIFLLDHIAAPNESPVSAFLQKNSGLLSAIGLKNAFVFQGGIGNVDHLFEGLLDGLNKSYPALFNLYATNFQKHGVSSMPYTPYASLALNSRTFPALRYDPDEQKEFLIGALDLEGNKDIKEDWVEEVIEVSDDEKIKYKITWADWSFTQSDWKNQFSPTDKKNSNLLVPDYIKLNEKARKEKTAVIMRADEKGLKYYELSENVVLMCETVLSNWNTLQELAGILGEFPLKLREEVSKELSKKYQLESAELINKYEAQLKEIEAVQSEKLRQRLKEKLVALSRMAKNKPNA